MNWELAFWITLGIAIWNGLMWLTYWYNLKELKSQVSNHSSPLIKEDEKPKTGEKSPVHAKKQLEK